MTDTWLGVRMAGLTGAGEMDAVKTSADMTSQEYRSARVVRYVAAVLSLTAGVIHSVVIPEHLTARISVHPWFRAAVTPRRHLGGGSVLILSMLLSSILAKLEAPRPEYVPLIHLSGVQANPVLAVDQLFDDLAPAARLYATPEYVHPSAAETYTPDAQMVAHTTIWAFGDSLATGFDEPTGRHFPPARYLAEDLDAVRKEHGVEGGVRYRVEAQDESTYQDLVRQLDRFEREVAKAPEFLQRYPRNVILLSIGGNDVMGRLFIQDGQTSRVVDSLLGGRRDGPLYRLLTHKGDPCRVPSLRERVAVIRNTAAVVADPTLYQAAFLAARLDEATTFHRTQLSDILARLGRLRDTAGIEAVYVLGMPPMDALDGEILFPYAGRMHRMRIEQTEETAVVARKASISLDRATTGAIEDARGGGKLPIVFIPNVRPPSNHIHPTPEGYRQLAGKILAHMTVDRAPKPALAAGPAPRCPD